jgi:hypothetical protein
MYEEDRDPVAAEDVAKLLTSTSVERRTEQLRKVAIAASVIVRSGELLGDATLARRTRSYLRPDVSLTDATSEFGSGGLIPR